MVYGPFLLGFDNRAKILKLKYASKPTRLVDIATATPGCLLPHQPAPMASKVLGGGRGVGARREPKKNQLSYGQGDILQLSARFQRGIVSSQAPPSYTPSPPHPRPPPLANSLWCSGCALYSSSLGLDS